ncbi:hypothetical protein M2451_003708 [Dysgonomonas sp. PFB1-18]|uniref:DUF5114 domain-containing protein n=2 Tax=Dysgonomonas TaxID=156973 RepID=UPI002475F87A|nr:DUF5114 domain-containing protein [Dysgonomonas sp. PF1-14]MDH6310436.1 hypothetical protein [Dysgonomonas sp. PF1-14]MDH6340747.1 hypothetical protein [Dysgonomonas sp. PF1-16]MDH6382367.1 hypothetical protein [Dysgonomonas sp. PFB1-18]MDH6399732.1 hypothetical protein [Dysgonomonas sp. PF1-23]
MNTMKNFILLLAAILSFISCEKDEDKIYLSSIEPGKLIATESEIVLLKENGKDIVLSLAWTKDALQISDPDLSPIDVIIQTLQASTTPDFSGVISESVETSLSKAYTGAALNAMAKDIGAIPDEVNNIYFRLAAKTGNNMKPVYSNTVMVSVTPYTIDMSIGFILDNKMADTGRTLYSAKSDGVYTGFMGATGWYNYFLQEGNGTTWGNDGVDGSAFLLSSEEDADKRWNFWFPGLTGCYHVEVNTIKKVWSALLIPTLTVSGDIQAEMTFDRPNVKWTTVFNATAAETLKIKLQGTGKQYDYSTGTDDNSAISTTIAFAQDGQNINLSGTAGEISVTVPEAGEYTLVVDLSNPQAWTCEVVSGSTGPIEINPHVYLPGIDDLTSGGWNFNTTLSLYNEDELSYAGVANVNSEWGYGIYTEIDNWSSFYKLGSGDAYTGTLLPNSETNLPAPAAGLYLLDVSLKGLTYNLTNIGSDIYVVGLHDQWDFNTALAATATAGIYTGAITINSASPWGFQIHIDSSWNHYFGGSDGKLYYKGSNITDDALLAPGTYQMTVDLINGTYSITQ